ncbi:MAG TPA: PTS fructose transporter subunit IIB, partial [Proteiniclasticum sp.]|nr:PTS fructose transporter subunit IIB [Proteiniclasticum sp.]
GAMGIENEITLEDLENADLVILAIETGINKMERFKERKVMRITINQAIGKTDDVFAKAEKAIES